MLSKSSCWRPVLGCLSLWRLLEPAQGGCCGLLSALLANELCCYVLHPSPICSVSSLGGLFSVVPLTLRAHLGWFTCAHVLLLNILIWSAHKYLVVFSVSYYLCLRHFIAVETDEGCLIVKGWIWTRRFYCLAAVKPKENTPSLWAMLCSVYANHGNTKAFHCHTQTSSCASPIQLFMSLFKSR